MVDRKWDELPGPCLVEIFARVGLQSLVDEVPYVCKSWYEASLSPLCWKSLIFPEPLTKWAMSPCWPTLGIYSLHAFVKFVIRRSHGLVNVVVFRHSLSLTKKVLNSIAEGCPSLKRLVLPRGVFDWKLRFSNLICKWKDLEELEVTTGYLLDEIIIQVSIHCRNFVSLTALGINVSQAAASAIASRLPNIKCLRLTSSSIERRDIITIMKGCRKLVQLDITFCIGFEVDKEIYDLGARIPTFDFYCAELVYEEEYTGYIDSSIVLDFKSDSD